MKKMTKEMNRFIFQKSQASQNWWVCTDTENGIVCIFEEHKFNDSKEFTVLEDSVTDANRLARATREMGDWLAKNHYDKLF